MQGMWMPLDGVMCGAKLRPYKKGHLELKSIIKQHSHFDAPTYVFTKHTFVFANLWKSYVARNKSGFFLI